MPKVTLPEGVDTPDYSNALYIPEGPAQALTFEQQRPPMLASGRLFSANSRLSASLVVDDEPASVFRRLNLALPRMGWQMLASDAQKQSFDISRSHSVAIERGWLSRTLMFWKDKEKTVAQHLRVNVAENELGSVVNAIPVSDVEPEVPAELIRNLAERLGVNKPE